MFKQRPANNVLIYFSLAFITMAGLAYINFLPGVVNALAGGIGFDETEAGQIVAMNGYGGLVGSTIAIFLVRRISWQLSMIVLLAGLALIDTVSAHIESYSVMLVCRFIAGIIGGLSLGIAFSVLARLDNPDRAFGTLLFVQFSVGSLVIFLLPGLELLTDDYAVFYVMAGFALSSVVLLLLLPEINLSREVVKRAVSLPIKYQNACLVLAAILMYQMAASAIWAYVGLIGLGARIAAESVNSYIAITGLLGLLGAMLPVVNGSRSGRLNWLVSGVALSITSALLLNFSEQQYLYVGSMALLFLSWPAVQSYLLAVTAEMDGSGRLATIAAVISFVGLATGPLLASGLLDNGNFSLMLYACAAAFLLSYLLLVKPVKIHDRSVVGVLSSKFQS